MCLVKTHIFPRFSFKKKFVYKFVVEYDPLKASWTTPFWCTDITKGTILKASSSWLKNFSSTAINGEGVHAYTTIERAVAMGASFHRQFPLRYKLIVVRAEIPPFTAYWKGEGGEIAATKMIIKDKVKYI